MKKEYIYKYLTLNEYFSYDASIEREKWNNLGLFECKTNILK